MEIHNPEIISLEDFYETDNPTIFVKINGDKAILLNPHTCMVIRKRLKAL